MSYFKALLSCKEKILAWDKKDYHALAASMDLEEIRSMVRELYEEDEAAALYEILFAI